MERQGTVGQFDSGRTLLHFVMNSGMIAAGNRHHLEFSADGVEWKLDSISVRIGFDKEGPDSAWWVFRSRIRKRWGASNGC